MNEIAKLYLEIGIIKDLQEKGLITKEEMDLAIMEIKKKLNIEGGCDFLENQ